MKKKIIYICVLFLIIAPFLYAQHAVGSWQNYLSYHNVTRTEPAGNIIYAVGNGSLFSYDKEDSSVQCYWKNYLLSDTDISSKYRSNLRIRILGIRYLLFWYRSGNLLCSRQRFSFSTSLNV